MSSASLDSNAMCFYTSHLLLVAFNWNMLAKANQTFTSAIVPVTAVRVTFCLAGGENGGVSWISFLVHPLPRWSVQRVVVHPAKVRERAGAAAAGRGRVSCAAAELQRRSGHWPNIHSIASHKIFTCRAGTQTKRRLHSHRKRLVRLNALHACPILSTVHRLCSS